MLGYLLVWPHSGDSNKYPKKEFSEDIRIKQCLSYISLCSLRILYNSKVILMATSSGTNAVVVKTTVFRLNVEWKKNYRIRPNYRTYPYKRTVKKFSSLQITTSVLFSLLLYKGICCGYSFELHQQVDAIQMSTHNICLCKESQKKSHSHH